MLYSLPFMLVSPCVPVRVRVMDRGRYGVAVRPAKNRVFLAVVLVLILADKALGLGSDCTNAEGSLEFGCLCLVTDALTGECL